MNIVGDSVHALEFSCRVYSTPIMKPSGNINVGSTYYSVRTAGHRNDVKKKRSTTVFCVSSLENKLAISQWKTVSVLKNPAIPNMCFRIWQQYEMQPL